MKFNIKKEHRPYIIGGLAVVVLYFLLFRKKKLLPSAEETALTEETAQAEATTGGPTYPQSQYNTWANQLESAMYDIGTDEDTVFAVFKNLKNDADYLKLVAAFGKRNYTGGYAPGMFYGDYDLGQWIREEFNDSDIDRINNILSSKGIKYEI